MFAPRALELFCTFPPPMVLCSSLVTRVDCWCPWPHPLALPLLWIVYSHGPALWSWGFRGYVAPAKASGPMPLLYVCDFTCVCDVVSHKSDVTSLRNKFFALAVFERTPCCCCTYVRSEPGGARCTHGGPGAATRVPLRVQAVGPAQGGAGRGGGGGTGDEEVGLRQVWGVYS